MLGHSVQYYLPHFWATTPLYSEKIIPLLDSLLSVDSPHADKLALAYYDIWNKVTSPENMTESSIEEYIKDHGYAYLLDLLSLSGDTLQNVLFLLPLIHYLKGSRKGLEVVLSLLQGSLNISASEITAWYEDDTMEEDTFSVESDLDLATIDSSFFEKFDRFVQKYVYPTLTGLTVSYSVSGTHTLLPVVTVFNTIDMYGTMDI